MCIKNFLIRFFLCIFLFFFFFTFFAYSYAKSINTNLSDSFFRLHIIANSDSVEDQNLKYLIRDELISYLNSLCSNTSSKEEVIQIAKTHQSDFQKIAENIIKENGFSYPVSVEIGTFPFPTKNYGNISLPSGYYDALKISIGKSTGQNWWCVMFPPLCFVDQSIGIVEDESMEMIEDSLPSEEYTLITSDENASNTITFKFKIVELIQNTNLFLNSSNK